MKTFKITYDGFASRFKHLNTIVEAESEREAVEEFYASKLPDEYFPDGDGDVYDSEGMLIALPNAPYFHYDGGCFSATEVDADFKEPFDPEKLIKELMADIYCGHKDEDGNAVYYAWQVEALMKKYARLSCEEQKEQCAATAKIHYKCENESWSESELSGRNNDGRWEVYTVDEDSIINTRNILEL